MAKVRRRSLKRMQLDILAEIMKIRGFGYGFTRFAPEATLHDSGKLTGERFDGEWWLPSSRVQRLASDSYDQ